MSVFTVIEPCPMCDGEGGVLGTLGFTTHFVCRHCGWQWSEEVDFTHEEEQEILDDMDQQR